MKRTDPRIADLIDQITSLTSSLTSLTPPTKPTLSSDDLLMMMKTMGEIFSAEREATRAMVLDILQGRPQPSGQTEIVPIENEQPTNFEDDPLPPEIQAVMDRETSETLAIQASLREREVLQRRLADQTLEMQRLQELQDSSPLSSESEIYPSTSD